MTLERRALALHAPLVAAIALLVICEVSCTREQQLLADARSLFESGDLAAALEASNQAIEVNPESDEAHYFSGMVFYSWGRYTEALESFDTAINLDVEVPHYILQRGDTLSRLGRYDEAIRDYEKVLEIDPGNERAVYAIGVAHYNRRDHDQAVRWLRRYERMARDSSDRERVQQMIEMLQK